MDLPSIVAVMQLIAVPGEKVTGTSSTNMEEEVHQNVNRVLKIAAKKVDYDCESIADATPIPIDSD